MKRLILTLSVIVSALSFTSNVESHDIITTAITWDREISRIVYDRCASCHHRGGEGKYSLMTYAEARPWATAIKEETLSRRMPPWGAIKGFGDFRNDQALTPEQLELITSWAEGGAPEGDPKDLRPAPEVPAASVPNPAQGGVVVTGDYTVQRPFKLDGLVVQKAPENESVQIIAELPDGSAEPLLWLYEYKAGYKHPFLYRTPIDLPKGTIIRGLPEGSSIILLPPVSAEP